MTSYLDAGALVTSGIAVGGIYSHTMPLSHNLVGLLLGTQTLMLAIGAVAGGRCADLWGRRRVLIASLMAYTCGVALLALAPNAEVLLAGMVLSGLGIGADLPASITMVGEAGPRSRRAGRVAATQVYWVIGIGASALLGLTLAPVGELGARLMYMHLYVVGALIVALRMSVDETSEWKNARRHATNPPLEPSTPRHGGWAGQPMLALPVIAIATFYACWNLGANTLGQFKTFIWVNVFDGSPAQASALVLAGLPIGIGLTILFSKVVNGPHRQRWIILGCIGTLAGWCTLTIWPTPTGFLVLVVVSTVGSALAGEALFKVMVQERVPTLRRATIQGGTIAIARLTAAAFAVATPTLATHDLRLLAAIILTAQVIAAVLAVGLARRSTARRSLLPPTPDRPPPP